MTALFIGVVSHEQSRFQISQGPDGLAHRLLPLLLAAGVEATVHINTDDAYDESAGPLTDAMVQSSLTAQLHLDRQWHAFLGRDLGPRWWSAHALRWARRVQQRVRPPSTAMIRRLLNIELSHFDLLRRAVDAGSDWALILEDDASSPDVEDCARGIAGLVLARDGQATPRYVNVSHSFSNEELGISHLLDAAPDATWDGDVHRGILRASRPVTNTVCAILYRTSFAQQLLATMEALPEQPVVPIDWKLNAALMNLFDSGEIGADDCWLVDPAPIDQLSMRTDTGQ